MWPRRREQQKSFSTRPAAPIATSSYPIVVTFTRRAGLVRYPMSRLLGANRIRMIFGALLLYLYYCHYRPSVHPQAPDHELSQLHSSSFWNPPPPALDMHPRTFWHPPPTVTQQKIRGVVNGTHSSNLWHPPPWHRPPPMHDMRLSNFRKLQPP